MDSARDHQSASRMSDHLAGLKATLRTEIDGQTCYDRFKELGFHYGPTFQAIEHVWLGDAGALSRIKVSVPVADLDGYHLHPVILDACFQMLLALTLDSENRERLGSFLPVGARSVRVNGRPEGEMWCHAWFTEQSPQAIAADIILMREDGTVLVEVRDFRAQSLSNMQLSGGSSSIDSWLYEAKWYEMPRATEPGAPAPAQTSGVWAIFADQGGLGAELAARIEGQGQKAVLIFAGSSYKCDGPQRYTIRPSEADDYNRLFADIARAEGEPCSAIVHLWAIDTDPLREPTQELLKAEQEKNVYAIRRVIQALDQHGQTPRLWLVTRGAQPVGKELTAGALSQATLWGMGRVL